MKDDSIKLTLDYIDNFGRVTNMPADELSKYSKEFLLKRVDYWNRRCLAAENVITESPCDPDITTGQIEAVKKWESVKNEKID